MYEVPKEYYFRIHHVRPRFKAQVENVLIFMATNISDLGRLDNSIFREKLNEMITQYPGNMDKEIKTINNPIVKAAPTKPNSSHSMAKIKSLWA